MVPTERLRAEGWDVDEDAVAAAAGDVVMTEPEQVAALSNSLRLRLLSSLARRPGSAKELAERFDVPTTRLYHHLDLLEEHGFVRVVATRRSGARTERGYAAAGGRLRIGRELLEGHVEEVAEGVAQLIGVAGETMAEAVRAGLVDLTAETDDPETSFLTWVSARLTPQQQRSFNAELVDLVERISAASEANAEDDGDGVESRLFLLLQSPEIHQG